MPQRLKDCPKNKQLAEKQSFEGNYKILRTNYLQPRAILQKIQQIPAKSLRFLQDPQDPCIKSCRRLH